jgi:glycosyltransferase involved in cell wall biosynthesis
MAEAQTCGTPLVAYAEGGAAEIAREDTGVLFPEQSAAAVAEALRRFEARSFSARACHENALRFDRARFRARFEELLRGHWERFRRDR